MVMDAARIAALSGVTNPTCSRALVVGFARTVASGMFVATSALAKHQDSAMATGAGRAGFEKATCAGATAAASPPLSLQVLAAWKGPDLLQFRRHVRWG